MKSFECGKPETPIETGKNTAYLWMYVCVCVCVCVWSWLMGVNGLGGKWQKDVTLKRDWHLTNYLLQWSSSRANICALVQTGGMGSIWESPLPFISPSLCPFPPAALSRQGSTGTQWPCRRRGKKKNKKKTLIYFPLPAAAAEGDGGMWSGTMTNK